MLVVVTAETWATVRAPISDGVRAPNFVVVRLPTCVVVNPPSWADDKLAMPAALRALICVVVRAPS